MRVSIHDLLHRALRVERAQQDPLALPLLAGWALVPAAQPGVRETVLHPRVPGQAEALSVGALSEVLLL